MRNLCCAHRSLPVVEFERKPFHGGDLKALLYVEYALCFSRAWYVRRVQFVPVGAHIEADLRVCEDRDVQAVAADCVTTRVDVDLDVTHTGLH